MMCGICNGFVACTFIVLWLHENEKKFHTTIMVIKEAGARIHNVKRYVHCELERISIGLGLILLLLMCNLFFCYVLFFYYVVALFKDLYISSLLYCLRLP